MDSSRESEILYDMVENVAGGGFSQDSSTSYIEKMVRPSSKCGIEIVQNELEISVERFTVEVERPRYFPKVSLALMES